MAMKNNMKKNFIWNAIGSTFNAMTSLFFMIVATRINGIDDSGIFTFAFSTACLLQVIGIYSGRAYQVTERDSNITNNDYMYNKIISCLIMIICAIIFIFIKGYSFYKCGILLFLVVYKAVEAFSESVYGIIQKNNELYKVGISLFLKGVIGLLLFIVADLITNSLIVAAISLIVTNLTLLLIYDLRNIKKYSYKKTKFNYSKIVMTFKYGFYTFLFTFLTQYVINAPKYAMDSLLAAKFQAIFGIIIMPATFMILCGQFVIHPFLVIITDYLNKNKIKELRKLINKIVLGLLSIGLVATLIAYLIGIPFLQFVYGIDLSIYLKSLIIIVIGATFFGMSYILSNALTAMRKTWIQVVIFVIASIYAYFVSHLLVNLYGVDGASLSYFFSTLLLLILYIFVFIFETNNYSSEVTNNE